MELLRRYSNVIKEWENVNSLEEVATTLKWPLHDIKTIVDCMKYLKNVDITNRKQIYMFDYLDINFLVQYCARSWLISNIREPLPCIGYELSVSLRTEFQNEFQKRIYCNDIKWIICHYFEWIPDKWIWNSVNELSILDFALSHTKTIPNFIFQLINSRKDLKSLLKCLDSKNMQDPTEGAIHACSINWLDGLNTYIPHINVNESRLLESSILHERITSRLVQLNAKPSKTLLKHVMFLDQIRYIRKNFVTFITDYCIFYTVTH